MQIYLRGGDRAVTQNLLDTINIHILLQQKRGKRVPERVRGHILLYATFLNNPTDHGANILW